MSTTFIDVTSNRSGCFQIFIRCFIERKTLKTYFVIEFFIDVYLSFSTHTGKQIYGMLFKPVKCVPGEKYPTLLYVYGGPGVQVCGFDELFFSVYTFVLVFFLS